MVFEFKTYTTMKPYNGTKWWIMGDIIPTIDIEADTLDEALEMWRSEVEGVDVSRNALKTKQPMYTDCKDGSCRQTGFVITGSAMFNDDYRRWSKQYVDCWVRVRVVEDYFLQSEM